MQFKCVRAGIGVREGAVYQGSIISLGIAGSENWQAGAEGWLAVNKTLRIVVFNDNGHWFSYHPSHFHPGN